MKEVVRKSMIIDFSLQESVEETADHSKDNKLGISGNAVLYTGLLIGSVGLLITFLGLGSRGFKTLEVKLLGPGLVGLSSIVVIFRIVILISAKKDKQMKRETKYPQNDEDERNNT